MSSPGTFLRRHFEAVLLSAQVLIDLFVVLLACWLGWKLREYIAVTTTQLEIYRDIFLLTAAVNLICFHAFGMYSPLKSLLNIEEFKAIAKSTVTSFLVVHVLIIFLSPTELSPKGTLYEVLIPIHKLIDLDVNPSTYSRLTVLFAFGLIVLFTTASRFASFKVIQSLHRRGIGNRNVLILGTGETARRLQKKFLLVPTLGLNLSGFVTDDERQVGRSIEHTPVLGTLAELEWLIRRHKVSEVFVATPEAAEDHVMGVVERLEGLGVNYHFVPRFYHLLAHKVRIESLDSIPLITRPDRQQNVISAFWKRALDVCVSLFVITVGAPLFLIPAILIKRESPGPVFFLQTRIGKNGIPFRMIKFRTMHMSMSGDAPKPRGPGDPRITQIGRWLRRYSLDELPQVLNVLRGEMSIVGPRPEMPFIVDAYGPMERERLRVKPGLTGLWQISYARGEAIHNNLEYDIYYIEHQSLLLDVVIISLTVFAVAKGTGAYIRVRILHVIEATIGGTRKHVVDVAREQRRRGLEVWLAAAAEREPAFRTDLAALEAEGVHTRTIPMARSVRPGRDWKHLLALEALLCEARPDVVHTHSSKAGVLGRLASQWTGIGARVHTPHTFAFLFGAMFGPLQRRLYREIESSLAGATDRVVAVSPSEAASFRASGVVPAERIRVVANGIDPSAWMAARAADLGALGIPPAAPVAAVVGLLNVAKGQDLALRALARPGLERVHLLVAGHGDLRSELEALARELGLEGRVHLLGWRDDVPALVARSDVVLVPSRWEGLPYVALEAMAAAKPVVATRVDGARDVVLDGETGRLVALESPGELGDALAEVLALSVEERTQWGRAGRARVLAGFTLERMVDGLLGVYAEVA